MKAKELKIGDYFYIENPLVKIKAIHGELGVTIAKYGDNALAGIEDLLPIPLTSEILEKNGWQYYAFYKEWEYCITDDPLLKIYEGERGFIIQDCKSFRPLHEIKYVHELQHILWALGMDDDLKI